MKPGGPDGLYFIDFASSVVTLAGHFDKFGLWINGRAPLPGGWVRD